MKSKYVVLNKLINEYNSLKDEYEKVDFTNQEKSKKLDIVSYSLFIASLLESIYGITEEKFVFMYLAFITAFIGLNIKVNSYFLKPKVKNYLASDVPLVLDALLDEIEMLKKEMELDEKIIYENTNLQRVRK